MLVEAELRQDLFGSNVQFTMPVEVAADTLEGARAEIERSYENCPHSTEVVSVRMPGPTNEQMAALAEAAKTNPAVQALKAEPPVDVFSVD